MTCVDAGGSCGGANVVVIAGDAVDPSITLTQVGPAGNVVTYNRDGRATLAAAFRITAGANNAQTPMRCVDVSVSGRPNTRADTNAIVADGCN